MTLIQSLQDFEQAKAEALAHKQQASQNYRCQIFIALGSCGIAAGAQDAWDAIQSAIADHALSDVQVTPTSCIGLCALEPIVQVQLAHQPLVTYGKVSPIVARRIVENHILNGIIVSENMVENQ